MDRSSNPVRSCWSIVLRRAKAYWKFLFRHKLCNVLTIWKYTVIVCNIPSISYGFFSFDTRFMRTLCVYSKTKQVPTYIENKKQICLYIIYVTTKFIFFLYLTVRGQPSNLTFIQVRNSTLDFHLCASSEHFAFYVFSTCLYTVHFINCTFIFIYYFLCY